jgi:hypothetical protein
MPGKYVNNTVAMGTWIRHVCSASLTRRITRKYRAANQHNVAQVTLEIFNAGYLPEISEIKHEFTNTMAQIRRTDRILRSASGAAEATDF